MLNQDKVLRNFKIALVVIVLSLMVSGWYHNGETAKAGEPIAEMSKSGGL